MARSKLSISTLTLKPSPETNAMVICPSRHKPEVGDLFVLNMLGTRWVAARVIRTDATAFGTDNRLLYFYNLQVPDPHAIQTPITPRLLIAPVLTNDQGWRRGYYLHLRNVPLQPEELLPRHVFENPGFVPSDARRYEDEYRNRTLPPVPGPPSDLNGYGHWAKPWNPPAPPDLPCGWSGLAGYRGIDTWLSWALGIPEKIVDAPTGTAGGRTGDATTNEHADVQLSLHIPTVDAAAELALDDLEDDLIEAMEESRAGRWEGHGTDLRTGVFDIRFVGSHLPRMIKALQPVLKLAAKDLPAGWYLTSRVGSGPEERIDFDV